MPAHPTPLETLRTRFALRLDAALDACGYPVRQSQRVLALARALGVDATVATAMTGGLHLPDYGVLLALCAISQREPGYFLDEQPLELPPGTTRVRPLLNGEDLVLRLPSEVLGAGGARQGLLYWRAPAAMGFGIAAGEYLIVKAFPGAAPAQVGKLYLLRAHEGMTIARCTGVQGGRALLQASSAAGLPLIVPAALRGATPGAMRQLVASIRCGTVLHGRS